jgi:hypothetical protein
MEHDDIDWDQDPEVIYARARHQAAGEMTKYAVDLMEYYSQNLGKNIALGLAIESISETLGNLISLVKEDHQTEVIDTAHQVMLQGIISQQKMIAEITYGQVGTG